MLIVEPNVLIIHLIVSCDKLIIFVLPPIHVPPFGKYELVRITLMTA